MISLTGDFPFSKLQGLWYQIWRKLILTHSTAWDGFISWRSLLFFSAQVQFDNRKSFLQECSKQIYTSGCIGQDCYVCRVLFQLWCDAIYDICRYVMYVWCFCSNFNKLVRYSAVPQLKVVCRIFMYFPLSGRKGFPATRTPNPPLYIEYIYIYCIVNIHIKNRQCITIQLYISWWLLSCSPADIDTPSLETAEVFIHQSSNPFQMTSQRITSIFQSSFAKCYVSFCFPVFARFSCASSTCNLTGRTIVYCARWWGWGQSRTSAEFGHDDPFDLEVPERIEDDHIIWIIHNFSILYRILIVGSYRNISSLEWKGRFL